MSSSGKEDKVIPSSISAADGISLLKRQKEKGKELITSRPLDFARYHAWKNTTREFIVNAFGSDSSNVKSMSSIGKYGSFPMNAGEEWWENHRVESLNNQLVMLDSLIEQLEARILLSSAREPLNVLSIIETLCCRFHLVVRQLRDRHDNRQPLNVEDEYDVQDLFHALLRLFFDDIRSEEWTPSYAGRASRMDFLLKDFSTVIEVKKTRVGLGTKEVGQQLIEDIARYQAHPSCTTLVCFVYDPEGRVSNPRGLENDLNQQEGNLLVKVLVVPRN
jgi:hypothetical protein